MKFTFLFTAYVAAVLTGSTATKTPVDDSYDSFGDDFGYYDPVSTDTNVVRNTQYIITDQLSSLSDPAPSSLTSAGFVSENHLGSITPTSFPTYASSRPTYDDHLKPASMEETISR